MAIRCRSEKPNNDKIEVDLRGPNGNAFVLLKLASTLCNRLGYDEDEKERILDEMRLTDYEGLLYTLDREFGDYIILWR